MSKYKKLTNSTRENLSVESADFASDLDAIAREGARRMLISTLEAEVTEFLGRQRYVRAEPSDHIGGKPGYRNGYGKQRLGTLGAGTVCFRAPRVCDSEDRVSSEAFTSSQRRSNAVREVVAEGDEAGV